MLDLINRYSHGFAFLPVVLACKKQGLFELLSQSGSMTLEQLVEHLGANEGHFRVALRMFQSLDWITRNETGGYSLTSEADAHRDIPEEILELYDFPMDAYLVGEQQGGGLQKWIDRSRKRWEVSKPLIADFLDGILVIPVLIALTKNRLFEVSRDGRILTFPRVSPRVRDELAELFVSKGWGMWEEETLVLTDVGRFMLDRTFVTGVTASYTPMFRRISDLIFGNSREVLGRNADGHEIHIDRSLNVMASGFQHEKYFAAVDDIILSIFNRFPFDEQPKYIADMGCGDGTLLKRVYDVIRSRSARGTDLDRHPIMMIGIDYNDEALEAAERTLADIPRLLLRGDIADPQQLIKDLMQQGIDDPENILHIRSFLDHDRPYLAPTNVSKVQARSALSYGGVYVDSRGHAIPPHVMVQSLVEHFQRWSELAGSHGLIIVEVHCLGPDVVGKFLDESESLHFDAYHAFSLQHLVEAEVFLMAAAEAGLFPKPGFAMRFPMAFPFSRISVNWFERRPYTIRHAVLDDLPELIDLEEQCWSATLRTGSDIIRQRIERFPNGHCVLEVDNHVAGVIYTQRLSSVDVLKHSEAATIDSLHVPEGPIIHLLGISVHPRLQDQALGDQLLEFVLQWMTLMGRIEGITGVTRCKSFGAHAPTPMEVYVHSRNERGELLDPILRFHGNHGAVVTGIIPQYRPGDKENEGKGVLIEYDVRRCMAISTPLLSPSSLLKRRGDEEGGQPVHAIVQQCIRSVMDQRKMDLFSPERPLREMGLDSLDLMGLRSLLSRHLGEQLDSTFFFKYSTPETITRYFEHKSSRVPQTTLRGLSSVGRETMDRPDPRPFMMPRRQTQTPLPKGKRSSPSAEKTSDKELCITDNRDSNVTSADAVAIIGMACRFPGGANNPDQFWALLHEGIDAITEVQQSRCDPEQLRGLIPSDSWPDPIKFGGFLDRIDQFDAQFFRIAPIEANSMDPQHRILLESTWEALEDAGLNPESLKETQTGVFVGISTHDYEMLQLKQNGKDACGVYFATGNSASVAAGRLSYFLGLQGPSMSVDTACSSSLVAVHLACRSLLQEECDLALAGGVNLILSPELSLTYSKAGMLSKDGRCRTFDAAANGFVRGEGCGVIVLKRLNQALSDNDRILAVVRGSAVNQDGPSNGLTAPNVFAQEAVIRKALQVAGVAPHEVSYVEAHGTGTSLGDPVEVKSLEAVYGRGRRGSQPLVIGSVKTNMGHAEAAAGIAALVKVVLSLRNNAIPPHLHFNELNPLISLEKIPAVIPSREMEWKRDASGKPRVAAVSSFGSSGTNCHVIVEEAPALLPAFPIAGVGPQLFVLSAKSEEPLRHLAQAFDAHLESHPEASLADVCHTSRSGRAHFEHRLAVVAESVAHLRSQLRYFVGGGGEPTGGRFSNGSDSGVAFLFTGQGSQYAGMGLELFQAEPRFRNALEHCDDILRPHLQRPLLGVLYPEAGEPSALDQTCYTQPALFALEYALAQLWKSWGIEPTVVMGHSIGEYVAACIAGVFNLEDGLKLIAARGRLMQSLPGNGKMVVIFADENRVTPAIEAYQGEVTIAAVNGPTNTVISGRRQSVDEIVERLQAQGVQTSELAVSHAFHSPLMEPMLDEFRKVAAEVSFSSPRLDLVSNVTGRRVTDEIATADYWCTHIRRPVRFAAGMQTLFRQGHAVFVEVGPKPILLGMGQNCLLDGLSPEKQSRMEWLPSLLPGVSDRTRLLQSLGAMYVLGQKVDWRGLNSDHEPRKVPLPTYPWQRTRYWIEPADRTDRKTLPLPQPEASNDKLHPLLDRRLDSPLHIFESRFNADTLEELKDHRILGTAVLPITAYLEMALGAAAEAFGADSRLLEDVTFHEAMVFAENEEKVVQIILGEAKDGKASWEIFCREEGEPSAKGLPWRRQATGTLRLDRSDATRSMDTPTAATPEEIRARCNEQVSGLVYYARLREWGFQFGAVRESISRVWMGDGEALAEVPLPEAAQAKSDAYRMDPSFLVAGFQTFAAVLHGDGERLSKPGLYFPVGLESFQFHARPDSRVWSHITLRADTGPTPDVRVLDVKLYDDAWQLVGAVQGLQLKPMDTRAFWRARRDRLRECVYEMTWEPKQHNGLGVAASEGSSRAPVDRTGGEAPSPAAPTGHLSSWIVFADRGGIGRMLAERLRSDGQDCLLVFSNESYQSPREGTALINPAHYTDYERLIEEVNAPGRRAPAGVVYLWGLDSTEPEQTTLATLEVDPLRSCGSALHLAQALKKVDHASITRLWLVTRGAQPVGELSGPLALAQAPLWGLGRVIDLEQPEIWGGLVDLDPGDLPESSVARLSEEIQDPDGEDQVVFRGLERFVARLEESRDWQGETRPLTLRSDGAYLITGGLGGLGLKVARWMAEQGARHLVLLGRKGLPFRPDGGSSPPDDTTLQRIEAIRAIEDLGATVKVESVDVSDWARMSSLFKRFGRTEPPLRGVFHAAATIDTAPLLSLDVKTLESAFRPKVLGAWALHQLTREMELDFFVFFSSGAALWGSKDLAHYAAANQFLDALAHHRRNCGLPALSINWGWWAGGGTTKEMERYFEQVGLVPMTDENCLEAIHGLLTSGAVQKAVSHFDWRTFGAILEAKKRRPLLEKIMARYETADQYITNEGFELMRRLEEAAPGDRRNLLLDQVRMAAAQVLGFARPEILDPKQGFFSMGMDSIMSVQLKGRLEASLGKPLPRTVAFEHPNIEALTTYIATEVLSLDQSAGSSDRQPLEEERAGASRVGDELSEEELVELLSEKLKNLQ